MVPGIISSPNKEEHAETNGQNRETNIDVTESTVQAPHEQQILWSSPKSARPSVLDQEPNPSLEANITSQQQGSHIEPQNLSASQKSDVKSGSTHSHSTHPESRHTSSSVILGKDFVCVLFNLVSVVPLREVLCIYSMCTSMCVVCVCIYLFVEHVVLFMCVVSINIRIGSHRSHFVQV